MMSAREAEPPVLVAHVVERVDLAEPVHALTLFFLRAVDERRLAGRVPDATAAVCHEDAGVAVGAGCAMRTGGASRGFVVERDVGGLARP